MDEAEKRIDQAIFLGLNCGSNDGAHHKMWVIDQMLRILAGDDYERYIRNFEDGGIYSWDIGSAP